MPRSDRYDIDLSAPPFDRLKGVRVLGTNRSGRDSTEHARHQLYVGRDRAASAQVLVKVTTKPGLVYERNLASEGDVLTTVNRQLPQSKTFPVVLDRGRLRDSRLYLVTYLFEEFALAMSISDERMPSRRYDHLRAALEVAHALVELHSLPVYHVDLNPMNILYRSERGAPIIRIVDFESAFDPVQHSAGSYYDPPTTPNYSAPEVGHQRPDARADIYSLGAVLYTMLAGFGWTWQSEAHASIDADRELDPALRTLLLKATAPEPARRFTTAAHLRDELTRYIERTFPGRL